MNPACGVTCVVNDKRSENLFAQPVIATLQQRVCLDRIIFTQDGVPSHVAKPIYVAAEEAFRKR